MISLWRLFGLITFALVVFVIVVYIGYYSYISKFAKKKIRRNECDFTARTTVVVPTFNEEATIKKKLENLYAQTYPADLMEIIVIDSASKDDTVKIVRDFLSSHKKLNIKIIVENERRGKSAAINNAFSCASPQSEIFLMTDVDAILKEDAVEKIVSRFIDPEIGAVCGTQVVLNASESRETQSETTYRHYYAKLRIGESALDSTPIFDGELAAYRADVIRKMKVKENLNADDSQLANMVRRKGYRSICDPEAIFYEYAPSDWSSKQIQKVRRGQGLSRMFWYNKDMMFKREYGKFGTVILPVNFFMHVISPFLVLFNVVLGLVFFFFFVFQSGNLVPWVILGVSVILSFDYFLLRRKFLDVAWTFFEYQMTLLRGILLFLLGRSQHKWQKVESIRNKFRNGTALN